MQWKMPVTPTQPKGVWGTKEGGLIDKNHKKMDAFLERVLGGYKGGEIMLAAACHTATAIPVATTGALAAKAASQTVTVAR